MGNNDCISSQQNRAVMGKRTKQEAYYVEQRIES